MARRLRAAHWLDGCQQRPSKYRNIVIERGWANDRVSDSAGVTLNGGTLAVVGTSQEGSANTIVAVSREGDECRWCWRADA